MSIFNALMKPECEGDINNLIFTYANEQKLTIIAVIFITHYIIGATDIQRAFCKQLRL